MHFSGLKFAFGFAGLSHDEITVVNKLFSVVFLHVLATYFFCSCKNQNYACNSPSSHGQIHPTTGENTRLLWTGRRESWRRWRESRQRRCCRLKITSGKVDSGDVRTRTHFSLGRDRRWSRQRRYCRRRLTSGKADNGNVEDSDSLQLKQTGSCCRLILTLDMLKIQTYFSRSRQWSCCRVLLTSDERTEEKCNLRLTSDEADSGYVVNFYPLQMRHTAEILGTQTHFMWGRQEAVADSNSH